MIQAFFRIVVPEDKREELLDVLLRLKGPTEVLRGCLRCHVVQDVEDDRVLAYLVEWETEQAMEEHLRSEQFRRLLPYVEMSIEPPQVSFSTVDQVRGIEFLLAALGSRSPRPGSSLRG